MPITLKSAVAFLPGRRRKAKHERQRVEQMTAAPGERRDVHIPDDIKRHG